LHRFIGRSGFDYLDINTKSVDQRKKCLQRHQKIQETIHKEGNNKGQPKKKEKKSYSGEAHQRVLPLNIVVKIE